MRGIFDPTYAVSLGDPLVVSFVLLALVFVVLVGAMVMPILVTVARDLFALGSFVLRRVAQYIVDQIIEVAIIAALTAMGALWILDVLSMVLK